MFESILSAKATHSQHLSATAQRELVRKYQEEGCRKSLSLLVESNLKLVCKVASRYKHNRIDPDDFLAVGVQGILRAADKYDTEAEASFSTYAYNWIRHYCGRQLEAYTKEPWMQALSRPINDNGGTVSNLISDPSIRQDALLEECQLIQRVQDAIAGFCEGLKERDEIIFQSRTVSADPATLQDLGDKLGLTKERIRQIENILLSKFKTYLLNVV
jgi:RNA polymerase sigma factor (sigma-70 family)